MKIDYYKILGIKSTATMSEIKIAYRKRARETHPDKNKNSKLSAEEFKEVNEAYSILSDVVRRTKYDMEEDCEYTFLYDFSYEDSLVKKEDIEHIVVEISLEDVYYGCKRGIVYKKKKGCEYCDGTGAEEGKVRECPMCKGKGAVLKKKGFSVGQEVCSDCEGKGYYYISSCKYCDGVGGDIVKIKKDVILPSGLNDKDNLRLKVDDILEVMLVIKVVEEDEFKKQNSNIYIRLDISLKDIILGKKQLLEYFGEEIILSIKENSKHKDIIIEKDCGFPILNTNGEHGDLVIELNLVYPELTGEVIEVIRQLP